MRDEIAQEAGRRAGYSTADVAALALRVQASPLPVVAALLGEGIKADDVILATCAVTGLAPAPRLLLRRPQIPAGIDVLGVRDAGGTPIGSVQGRTWVAFSDPEAARPAVFSDDIVVCIATDADLQTARARFADAHPAQAGAFATMPMAPVSPALLAAIRAGVAPASSVTSPAPFDEDTLASDRLSASTVQRPRSAERTLVTAPPEPPAQAPVDVDRERLERMAQLGRLRRFRFDRVLGQGGMATVYLAADREQGDAHVAVKVLAPRLQDDPLAIGRFRRELRALMALHHPHIVAIVDGDAESGGGPCWLACHYLDGGTLRDLLLATGPLPAVAVLPLVGAILEAQAHAHAAGIIHRDLKPQNILLGRDGSLCIADFGVASAIGDMPLTNAGTRFGTPAYMSPEQARGGTIDNRSDLFSTGAILCELLAGQSPFVRGTALETMRAVANGQATPLPPVVAVPAEVRTLLDALLAVDRQARPPDAEAALRVLRPLLDRCPRVDEVVRRLLADPRAFADVGIADVGIADDTVAGGAGDDLLTGATRDIEALAAGFDDDAPFAAQRPATRPTPPGGTSRSVPPVPPVPPVPSSTPGAGVSAGPKTALPARVPTATRPRLPRAVIVGLAAVFIVGLALGVLWPGR